MLTAEDLKTIKARADACSPGPWTHCKECKCDNVGFPDGPVCKVTKGKWGDSFPSIRLVDSEPGSLSKKAEAYIDMFAYGEIPEPVFLANRDFIAHAREDVPNLVAEIERLRANLQGIADIKNKENGADWDEIDQARYIARQALDLNKGTPLEI